ncbi:AraC family transcriptional regulator [Streptomyces sp. NPDC016309]|uniref:helix-turn-helix transcriptional regulator n=1 Tax=Streptomyces sp. NPDC016309 TaxID=3364965 RepID=UPI0036F5ABF8
MIGTVFRSEDVPAGERFDRWRELIDRTRANEASSDHAADFRAELRVTELGPVTVWRTSFPPVRFRRSARRVRQADSEFYHLSLLTHGRLTQSRERGGTTTVGADDLIVDSSWQACEASAFASGQAAEGRPGVVAGVGVDLPKSLLPLPPRQAERLLGHGLSVRNGTGALLADFLTGLERQADTLRPADAARLGTVTLDLVAAFFAHALDAEAALPPESRHEVLARRIRTYMSQHLPDPELTPGAIAAAHHISLSHLHRVFGEQSPGETVAARIRSQRLEKIRADLADPALRTCPIHALAARWGMPHASQFTRAFRAAYGLSPREYRQQAMSEQH